MSMNSATSAARTAAQLHQAAQEVARLATRRHGEDVQVAAPAASQRLELAITKVENLLSGDPREAQSGDSCDLLRGACAEMAEAARNFLQVAQLVEHGH
jgi:hypothetical protein